MIQFKALFLVFERKGSIPFLYLQMQGKVLQGIIADFYYQHGNKKYMQMTIFSKVVHTRAAPSTRHILGTQLICRVLGTQPNFDRVLGRCRVFEKFPGF